MRDRINVGQQRLLLLLLLLLLQQVTRFLTVFKIFV
jgi:hypothetical protein